MNSTFKSRLKSDEKLMGTLLSLPSPEIAELLAKSGFDWLFVDMEHSTIDLKDAQRMIQAASPFAHCIVRVPGNDEIWIKRILDTGAEGIIVPQVNTKEEAEIAVQNAKYPTQGDRSVGISRAHDYGLSFNTYMRRANEDITLIIQCEHIESVKNLPAILQVEGIDAIFVGPYDLSASMGKTGQVKDKEVVANIEKIQSLCAEHNMPAGIFGGTPDAVKNYHHSGFNLVAVSIDMLMISQSAKKILSEMKGDE